MYPAARLGLTTVGGVVGYAVGQTGGARLGAAGGAIADDFGAVGEHIIPRASPKVRLWLSERSMVAQVQDEWAKRRQYGVRRLPYFCGSLTQTCSRRRTARLCAARLKPLVSSWTAATDAGTGRELEHCQRSAAKIVATREARCSSYDRM